MPECIGSDLLGYTVPGLEQHCLVWRTSRPLWQLLLMANSHQPSGYNIRQRVYLSDRISHLQERIAELRAMR